MKLLDSLTFALGIGGTLAAYLLLPPPFSFVAAGVSALFAAWSLFADAPGGSATVLRLGGLPSSVVQLREGQTSGPALARGTR